MGWCVADRSATEVDVRQANSTSIQGRRLTFERPQGYAGFDIGSQPLAEIELSRCSADRLLGRIAQIRPSTSFFRLLRWTPETGALANVATSRGIYSRR